MKQIYYILIFCLFLSCSKDINLLEDIAIQEGGYIEFKNIPTLTIDSRILADSTFTEPLVDNNNSALSYKITAFFENSIAQDFITINSFPADLTFKFQDLADSLGVSVSDFDELTEVRFLGTVTTNLGEYFGEDPSFGGNTHADLLFNPRQALQFTMSFFTPPPYHLRKTSFEEPLAYGFGVNYVKLGAESESEDIGNHPGEPIVDYIAIGTTRDDELGFNSEIIIAPNTQTGQGFTEEQIGVTNQLIDFDAYPDGNQGFRIEDIDNQFRMTFDTVDIPSDITQSGVQIKLFFKPTTWEDSDYVRIFANIVDDNGSRELEIYNIRGADGGLDDIDAVEGTWLTIDTGFLDNIKSYQVIIDADVSQDAEEITWDNLLIYIPDPI
jgi:hypothetical protein